MKRWETDDDRGDGRTILDVLAEVERDEEHHAMDAEFEVVYPGNVLEAFGNLCAQGEAAASSTRLRCGVNDPSPMRADPRSFGDPATLRATQQAFMHGIRRRWWSTMPCTASRTS